MALNRPKNFLRAVVGREAVKLLLGFTLRWDPMRKPAPGYSIILPTPWDMQELLNVNLTFVSKTDLANCLAIHVVFDRRQRTEHAVIMEAAKKRFPDLPLEFHFLDGLAGRIVELTDVTQFYHAAAAVTGLRATESRYAILHDFDLYPLIPQHFERIAGDLRTRNLRFSGPERTYYDGLTDANNVIGTWALGIDASYVRDDFRPIDVFHRVQVVNGRPTTLDPFSAIELSTPKRDLTEGARPDDYCHVNNLCDTYRRYQKGEKVRLAWKLHMMWYLQTILDGRENRLEELVDAMNHATDMVVEFEDAHHDFEGVDPTCANVLESQIGQMEQFLHGDLRPVVTRYLAATKRFLKQT